MLLLLMIEVIITGSFVVVVVVVFLPRLFKIRFLSIFLSLYINGGSHQTKLGTIFNEKRKPKDFSGESEENRFKKRKTIEPRKKEKFFLLDGKTYPRHFWNYFDCNHDTYVVDVAVFTGSKD